MVVGLEVYDDESMAELKILHKNVEYVIQICQEDGKVHLTLESGHFEVDTLSSVVLEQGLEILQWRTQETSTQGG